MTCSRFATTPLLTTALCCAGCISSLWVADPSAHELEVVELSEAQMQHGGFGSAGAKSPDASSKPAANGNPHSASSSGDSASATPDHVGPADKSTDGDKQSSGVAVSANAAGSSAKEVTPAVQQPGAGRNSVSQNTTSSEFAKDADPAKQIDSRQMLALLAELQSAGAVDAKTQQELLDDLKQTDPALWPQLIRQFRTALAYRQHMAGAVPGATTPSSASLPTTAAISATPMGSMPGAAGSQLDPLAAMFSQMQASAARSVGSLTSPGDSLLGPSITATPAGASAVMAAQASLNSDATSNDAVAPTEASDALSAPPSKPKGPQPANAVQRASLIVDSAPDRGSKTNPAPRTAKSTASTSPKSGHQSAASNAKDADESRQRLTETILAAESQAAGGQTTPAEIERQLHLRFLYLAAGRRDDALRPIQGLPPDQQEFWTKELYGLGTYLDAQRIADPERRATEAALHLHEAAGRLGEMASPVVHNLTFCKEVTSYGVFKRFPKYEFKPAEEVLLYCEIENLKSQSTDLGFHTNIKSSYQILDNRGERISEQEFPPSDDYCSNPRRDFFIPYFIALPKRINPGNYTLQLTIEDTQRNKIGQSSIQFTVK
jgi:hypothetical protein